MWALGQAGFYDLSQGLRGGTVRTHRAHAHDTLFEYVDTVLVFVSSSALLVPVCLPFLLISQQNVLTQVLGSGLMKQQQRSNTSSDVSELKHTVALAWSAAWYLLDVRMWEGEDECSSKIAKTRGR